MSRHQFSAQIERDRATGVYIAYVPALSGAHTQAKSLDELQVKLKEVIELCLEELTLDEIAELPEFAGYQQIAVEI